MMTALDRPRTIRDLRQLLGDTATAAADVALTGLSDDSRQVEPGHVFFARRGSLEDGTRYARQALAQGAVYVIAETTLPSGVPGLVVPDVDTALCRIADAWYGRPQDALDLLAVTGTKGKSTVAWIAAAALRACDVKPAVLGTIAHDLGDGTPETSHNTTPGILELRRLLARARDAGCRAAVMEVSSHALDQGRTAGLDFRSAIFTNLASDHMDYHRTPEAYFAAKALLFEGLSPGATAVLNREDRAWSQFAGLCRGGVLTYGLSPEADLRATDVRYALDGTTFQLVVHEDGRREVKTPLVGRHNVFNILAALGGCVGLGLDPMRAADGATALALVPGRLERVAGVSDIDVFVDYAHTEDALRQVLSFLRDVGGAPVTCVIGCGGDRDTTKRPLMARAAADLSAAAVFTSDNPRTEDPAAILDAMLAGLSAEQRAAAVVEIDRRSAIEYAVLSTPPGGVVLVAGKGHETYQIHGTERVPFDDVAECGRALHLRAARRADGNTSWGASQA
jgi:UDP-N-acetylmuramoyl-L-alanyl-D-glutamate--2,6-diaminopimelate ligase